MEPAQQPPPGGTSKPRSTAQLAIVSVLVVVGLMGIGYVTDEIDRVDDDTPTFTTRPPTTAPPAASTVLYEVEGSAGIVSVTVESPTGTEQAEARLPLKSKAGTRGLTMQFPAGSFVYIAAQNQGEWGTVTCRITVDGLVVSENSSSGAYSIASCKGQT